MRGDSLDWTHRRETAALLIQVTVGAPLIGSGHEDALVPLLVLNIAPALQVRPQRPLALAMDGDLGSRNPPVLV